MMQHCLQKSYGFKRSYKDSYQAAAILCLYKDILISHLIPLCLQYPSARYLQYLCTDEQCSPLHVLSSYVGLMDPIGRSNGISSSGRQCGCGYQMYFRIQKKPRSFDRGFVLALPIFPGRHQPSIVGANELNFCVRDGNRWTLIAINTNYLYF